MTRRHFSYRLTVGTFITLVCSCSHVVLLARLRYELLAFPIEGMSITSKRMIYQSVGAWTVSIIAGIPYGFHTFLNVNRFFSRLVEMIFGTVLCLFTLVPIVAFHIMKIRIMKQNVTPRRQTIRNMNKIIIAICIVQIVALVPGVIINIIDNFFLNHTFAPKDLFFIPALLILLSHSLNPVLFFYFNFCKQICVKLIEKRTKTAQNDNISREEIP